MTSKTAEEMKAAGPATRRMVVLGLLIGLFLALVAAWLLGFLDWLIGST